jgi:hypothetical protein
MTETLCNSLKVNPDTVRPVEGLTERRIRWKNPGNELRPVANHGPRPNYTIGLNYQCFLVPGIGNENVRPTSQSGT